MASSLLNKLQTNITIGLVSWYCYVPGITYNGSYASDYPEVYNPKYINLNGQSGFYYVIDAAARAAVSIINSRADILPQTTVNVKRFSDCGPYWSTVEHDFSGHTGGYAMAVMGKDIGEKHKDVIGMVGHQYSSVAQGTAEVLEKYQIPLCSENSAAPRLIWKINRMVIISQSDDLMSKGFTSDILGTAGRSGIRMYPPIQLKGELTQDMVDYAKTSMLRNSVRYVYISGQDAFVAKVYFSLALLGMVGPSYVYMGLNPPKPITSSTALLSPQRFLHITPLNEQNVHSEWVQPLYDEILKASKFDKDTLMTMGFSSPASMLQSWAISNVFDCTMLMLLGMDKLLKDNPTFTAQQLASRDLSKYLNYSQFLNISYRGLTADPLLLNPDGDLLVPYNMLSLTGGLDLSISANPFLSKQFAVTNLAGTKVSFIAKPFFYGGSSDPPPDGPPEVIITFVQNDLFSSRGQGILIMAIIGILLSSFLFAIFLKFKETKQLKLASVPECLVAITGTMMCYCSLLSYLDNVTEFKCIARMWVQLVGYLLTILPIVVKNARLYVVLNSKKRLDGAQLTLVNRIVLCIGLIIQGALLAYWTVSTKNTPILLTSDANSFLVCATRSKPGSASIELLVGYGGVVHLCLALFAYLLRDADSHLNESPALTAIFALVAMLVGLYQILPSNPGPRLDMFQALCIWMATTLTLFFMFAQKVSSVVFEEFIEKTFSFSKSFEGTRSSEKKKNLSNKSLNALNTKEGSNIRSNSDVRDSVERIHATPAIANTTATTLDPAALTRKGSKRETLGMQRSPSASNQNLAVKKTTDIGIPKGRNLGRPCLCETMSGIQIFKMKSHPTQAFWSVWDGGVCYINHARKTAWVSLATLGSVHTLTLTATMKADKVPGLNQISISDFPMYQYRFILEFKDEASATAFINAFSNHKTRFLSLPSNE
ncbi:periplasmic binding protein-like I [Obelidium mucronatum]|nr:periplasmic binding protein-like I [Obelidium mucronatum]